MTVEYNQIQPRVNNSFVGDCSSRSPYVSGMPSGEHVQHNASWLREQRERLGWSASEVAERARAKAREYGDDIKLSQQLVSKFENGGLKSTPRWLGYVQMAVSHYLAERGLPPGTVWAVHLPTGLKRYIEDRVRDHNLALEDDDLDDEEWELIAAVRALPREDRSYLLRLAKGLRLVESQNRA